MTTKSDEELEKAASDSFVKANVVRTVMLEAAKENNLSPQGLTALCITVICEIISATCEPDDYDGQVHRATQLANALVLGTKQKFFMDNGDTSLVNKDDQEADKPAVH